MYPATGIIDYMSLDRIVTYIPPITPFEFEKKIEYYRYGSPGWPPQFQPLLWDCSFESSLGGTTDLYLVSIKSKNPREILLLKIIMWIRWKVKTQYPIPR